MGGLGSTEAVFISYALIRKCFGWAVPTNGREPGERKGFVAEGFATKAGNCVQQIVSSLLLGGSKLQWLITCYLAPDTRETKRPRDPV